MRTRACVMAGALALAAAWAWAREGEGVDVPVRPVGILNVDADAFLRGSMQTEKQKSPGFTSKETDMLFEEGVDFGSTGYFYHPNLFEWRMDLLYGKSQEKFSTNGQDFDSQGTIGGYNISGLALKEKPVTVRAFASDNQSNRDRDFASTTQVREIRRGAEVMTKGSFPTTFLYEHIEDRETSDIRDVQSDANHYRATAADRRDPNWLTELTFDRLDKEETADFNPVLGGQSLSQNLPDHSNEANLNNTWRFGPGEDKSSLVGNVRALDRTGTFENQILSAQERLELVHTPDLLSFYQASWEKNKTVDETDTITAGSVGLTRKFYDSLDLTFQVDGRDEEFDMGFQKSLRGAMNADYRKKTLLGMYTSSLLIAGERRHETAAGGLRQILRETVVLPDDFTFVALANPNVVGGLTVVDAVTELPVIEGVQFEVRTTGAFTELRRVPLSPDPLPAGRAILVTYTVRVGQDDVVQRNDYVWANRLKLDKIPVSVYVNLGRRDEDLVEGDDPGNLDPQRSFLGGVEYDNKGFLVAVEHEIHDMTLSPPTVASRVRAGYRGNLSRNLDFSLSANAEHLIYRKAEEFGLEAGRDFLDTIGGNASLSTRLGNHTVLRLSTDAVKTRGRENRTLVRNVAALAWQYGKMDLSVEARYDILDQEETTGDAASLMFYLKRKF